MLAIETAEIGGTLIALSVPGLKPLIDKWIVKRGNTTTTARSDGDRNTFRSHHGPVDRGQFGRRLESGHITLAGKDNDSSASAGSGFHGGQYVIEEEELECVPLKGH